MAVDLVATMLGDVRQLRQRPAGRPSAAVRPALAACAAASGGPEPPRSAPADQSLGPLVAAPTPGARRVVDEEAGLRGSTELGDPARELLGRAVGQRPRGAAGLLGVVLDEQAQLVERARRRRGWSGRRSGAGTSRARRPAGRSTRASRRARADGARDARYRAGPARASALHLRTNSSPEAAS